MSRSFAMAVFALAAATTLDAAPPVAPPARPLVPVAVGAAEAAPETLLSPTTQLYIRWAGVAVMAGPTGDSIRALLAKGPKLLGNSLLAEPLLEGKPPAELKGNLADLKNADKVINLLADKGVVIGAEIREPAPTLKGLGSALGMMHARRDERAAR